ncbi:MAG: cysteine sulfinate desulfinase [Candidatus Handelsmanbacteria bacterium RIFCSPLOWO2_12_FULL_64_10]|uniref:Cysteine desulfurase n=1 Tax=Handelsmanbacteria sp. (strain RIFCSPLOWO2_12_FULL_64_10) TaxID=1817868 RepID=A0A1F6CFT8_HANXR|nr:MAG: cysteine sulfinate desulfinase [Candidatus Handelsmanbacteria bacterium RIFCSPLOWO2_12_FULL_64_10]
MSAAYLSLARSGPAETLAGAFDVEKVRADFPILKRRIYDRPLVYLDNAATAQKPQAVIDAIERYYSAENSNVHRGVHYLSQRATCAYEGARAKVRGFLNAAEDREVVFTRGTTEAINLVAQSYGRGHVREGDEIIISEMEHHSNIVPWQMLCEERGAVLRVIPIDDRGELLLEEYERLLNKRTRFVSVVHASNVLGTVNPVQQIVKMAHRWNVPVLVDGAQAVPHAKVDVQELDCDFYAFSGHKLYGPTGIGVLYGKIGLLEAMPPYQGGGSMIRSVTFEKTTYAEVPNRFEAGTPHIEGGIGLGAAVDYVNEVGAAAAYEEGLLAYTTEALREAPGLRLIGTARQKVGVLSFVMGDIHPHDIGTILDREGVAVRAGHHCAQPLMRRFGVPATARASLAFYNTREDVDALVRGLHKAREVFG